jgi:hypothetical protein
MNKLIINLPFSGFYESWYSSEIDEVGDREAEHFAEKDTAEQPEELRISESDYADILFHVTDYSAAHHDIARQYVPAFDELASEAIGFPLGLEFEKMDSPREYNFATDRIYAYITLETVQALRQYVKPETMAAVIRERFTSYDGFISSYSNDAAEWAEKPLDEYDHNELGTLLIAAMRDAGMGGDWDMSIFQSMAESEVFYTAHSNAVDWPKFEERQAEKREELAEEIRADDPDYVAPPVRCNATLDMFTGRAG